MMKKLQHGAFFVLRPIFLLNPDFFIEKTGCKNALHYPGYWAVRWSSIDQFSFRCR